MQDDDSIAIECSQFMQKYMIFFRTKPHFEPLSQDFMEHAIRTISNLTPNRPDLKKNINAVVTTTNELISGNHNQQTLNHIANA